jgi:PAXNEB protein
MASTFRRRSGSTNTHGDSSALPVLQLPGTKVWTAGCVLVSTGLRELDALILGAPPGGSGGQPLGSCILIESDHSSILSNHLVLYWCAEVSS